MRDIEQAPGEPGNEWRVMLDRLKSNAESISYTIDMLIEVLAKVESKAHAGKLSEAAADASEGVGVMAVRVWRLLNIVRTAAEIAIRPRHVGGQMTTLNFDELLSPEDAFDNAMRRKLDHIAMIMMWAKQMQTEGRLPPDVAKAMDDYFSGADCGGNPGGGGSVL